MAAKVAIRRQCEALLRSEKVRISASNNQWVASMAVLASAAAAAAVANRSRDDEAEKHPNAGMKYPVVPRRRVAPVVVQCEALQHQRQHQPYQRVSQRPNADNASSSSSNGGVTFAPWQSVTSSASRKSLLHHRKTKRGKKEREMDMHEKYNIDFNSVLGEGVSYFCCCLRHSIFVCMTFVLKFGYLHVCCKVIWTSAPRTCSRNW